MRGVEGPATRPAVIAGAFRGSLMAAASVALLICLVVYLRSLWCGFVNMDDPDYILNNAAIRQLDLNTVQWAFTSAHAGWWMPLTWLTFALDYSLWGLNPVGYHLTNSILHAVNCGMVVLIAGEVYRILDDGAAVRASVPSSAGAFVLPLLAGLMFGLHPLRVESVAWVTERKDVLNGLFTLLSVIFYLRYVRKGTHAYYISSLVLFACSLMAKSVSVVLPIMFLVADWFPLGRLHGTGIKRLVAEKIPFLVLSLGMAAITVHFAGESRYLVSFDLFPLEQRLVVSGNALIEYCRLMLMPSGVVYLYMIPDPVPASYTVKAVLALLLACTSLYAGIRHPAVTTVFLMFFLPLLPVLAFFQNGDQSYAARFTYLPSVIPSIAAAWLAALAYRKLAARWAGAASVLSVSVVLLLFVYAGVTLQLIATWDTTGTIWTRVIEYQPEAMAYKERGVFRYTQGRYEEAAADFTASISTVTSVWRPYLHNLYAHRGEALRSAGRYGEAVRDFTEAIRRLPRPEYYHFRAVSLRAAGREAEASEDFRRAGSGVTNLGWYWEEGAE